MNVLKRLPIELKIKVFEYEGAYRNAFQKVMYHLIWYIYKNKFHEKNVIKRCKYHVHNFVPIKYLNNLISINYKHYKNKRYINLFNIQRRQNNRYYCCKVCVDILLRCECKYAHFNLEII